MAGVQQHWRVIPAAGGRYAIQSVANGQYLSPQGAGILQTTSAMFAAWELVAADARTVLIRDSFTNQCALFTGGVVRLAPCNRYDTNQLWQLSQIFQDESEGGDGDSEEKSLNRVAKVGKSKSRAAAVKKGKSKSRTAEVEN